MNYIKKWHVETNENKIDLENVSEFLNKEY